MTVLISILVVILSAIGDIWSKHFATTGAYSKAFLSLSIWMLANSLWLSLLRRGIGMGRGWILIGVPCAILAIVIGVWFGETFTFQQKIGLLFGVVSMSLLI